MVLLCSSLPLGVQRDREEAASPGPARTRQTAASHASGRPSRCRADEYTTAPPAPLTSGPGRARCRPAAVPEVELPCPPCPAYHAGHRGGLAPAGAQGGG